MKNKLIICLVFILLVGVAFASGNTNSAYNQAKKEADKATVQIVENIDLDEFAEHFGLTLTAEDEMLIKAAMLAYTNGALNEHPFGTGSSFHSRSTASFSDIGDSYTYIGNKNSKIFHKPSCSSVSDMKDKNKVVLDSREAAIQKGFKPCKKCNP